jgi:hypothetical protein
MALRKMPHPQGPCGSEAAKAKGEGCVATLGENAVGWKNVARLLAADCRVMPTNWNTASFGFVRVF